MAILIIFYLFHQKVIWHLKPLRRLGSNLLTLADKLVSKPVSSDILYDDLDWLSRVLAAKTWNRKCNRFYIKYEKSWIPQLSILLNWITWNNTNWRVLKQQQNFLKLKLCTSTCCTVGVFFLISNFGENIESIVNFHFHQQT